VPDGVLIWKLLIEVVSNADGITELSDGNRQKKSYKNKVSWQVLL
jgi:hypothetical protein